MGYGPSCFHPCFSSVLHLRWNSASGPHAAVTCKALQACASCRPQAPLHTRPPPCPQPKPGRSFIDWLVKAVPSTCTCCSAVTQNCQLSILQLGRYHLEVLEVLCFRLDVRNRKLAECQRSLPFAPTVVPLALSFALHWQQGHWLMGACCPAGVGGWFCSLPTPGGWSHWLASGLAPANRTEQARPAWVVSGRRPQGHLQHAACSVHVGPQPSASLRLGQHGELLRALRPPEARPHRTRTPRVLVPSAARRKGFTIKKLASEI